MLLLIDNFDSFTHNLVQYFSILGEEVIVKRNNVITVEECFSLKPDYIVLGPGPGKPDQAGITKDLIKQCMGRVPLLGICLGMQAIAEVFGGLVVRCSVPMHGKTSKIAHNGEGIYTDIPQNFTATRYHSLVVDKSTFPVDLEITALSDCQRIMSLRHRELPIDGVQYHPESILTEAGLAILKNFLHYSYKSHHLEEIYYV